MGLLTSNEMENTVLLLPGHISTSFQCCNMPCWCGCRYEITPDVFAQNSCWAYASFLSLDETPVMILITVKLLNSIIMSTWMRYNFIWMFFSVLQKISLVQCILQKITHTSSWRNTDLSFHLYCKYKI